MSKIAFFCLFCSPLEKIMIVSRKAPSTTSILCSADYWTLILSCILIGVVLKDIATGAAGFGFDYRTGQSGTVSPTARHRCNVSSELCCAGAQTRRRARALGTRVGVIPLG